MASKVVFEVIATSKGLKVVQQDLKKTSKNTDELAKSQDKAAKTGNKYDKQNKAVFQGNLSSAKGFSKMNETLGSGGSSGLVAAYATLAANVFAATAAFAALKKAAQLDVLIDSLSILGAASGQNLGLLAQQLREAAGGAIDLGQAMQTASVGASAGFDATQIKGLAEVAKMAAIALGRDVGDAVDRLTRGAAKLEPEILDELGIFVRLDDAAGKYAAQLGKATGDLTRFEKRQAFANEILDQGVQKFGQLEGLDASAFDQLGATLMDLAKNFTTFFNSVLGPIAGFLAQNQLALAGLIAVLTKGIITAALPMLNTLGDKLGIVAAKAVSSAQIQIDANTKAAASYTAQLKPIKGTLGAYTALVQKYRDGTITLQEQMQAEKILNDYILSNASSRNSVVQKRVDLAREELSTVRQVNNAKENVRTNKNLDAGGKAELKFAGRGKKIFENLDKDPSFKGYMKAFKKANQSGRAYSNSMKKSQKSTLIFGRTIPFLSKGLATGGTAFTAFGLSAKVAVKGIFTAIPVIGQVLLVVDLLIAGIKKLVGFIGGLIPEATAAEKAVAAFGNQLDFVAKATTEAALAQKGLADQFIITGKATGDLIGLQSELDIAQKDLGKNANILGKIMLATGVRIKFVYESLTAGIRSIPEIFNIAFKQIEILVAKGTHMIMSSMGGIISFLNKIFEATGIEPIVVLSDDEQTAKMNKLNAELKVLKDLYDGTLSNATFQFFGAAAVDEIKAMSVVLQSAGPAAKELQTFLGVMNANELVGVLEGFIDLDDGIKDMPENLKNLSDQFDKNGDGILQQTELQHLLTAAQTEGTKTTRKQGEALTELREGFRNSSEQIAEYNNTLTKKGPITAYAGTIKTLVDSMNELSTVDGIAAMEDEFKNADKNLRLGILNGIELSVDKQAEFNAELAEAQKETKGLTKQQFLLGAGAKFYAGSIQGSANAYNALLQRISEAQIMDKSRLAVLQQQEKAVKKQAKLNAAATGAQIDLSNQQRNINVSRLTDELSALEQQNKLIMEKASTEEGYNSLTQEELGKLGVMREKANELSKEKELQIGLVERQALIDQQILGVSKLQLAADKKITKQAAAQLVAEQKLAAAKKGEGTRVSPAQELKARIEANKNAILFAQREKNLLDEKLRVELLITKARLLAAGITDTTLITEIEEGMRKISTLNGEVLTSKISQLNAEGEIIGLSEKGVKNMDLLSVKTKDAMAVLKTSLEEGALKDAKPFSPEMFAGMNDALAPMRETLKEFGPEGELIAAAQEGIFSLGTAFMDIGAAFKEGGGGMMAAAEAASQAISVISNLQQANTKAQVSELDKQIEAEKNRDGKSKESLSRIAGMEKKKEQIQRKAFEQKKKMDIAQAVISTALGITRALELGPVIGPILAVMQAAMGMAQISMIKKQTFQGGSSGEGTAKPQAITIGKRDNKVDVSQGATSGELSYLRGAKGIGSSANNFNATGGAAGLRGYANGGSGILVGERGPEVMSPSVPVDVYANDKLGSGTTNANFTINAVDAAGVAEVLTAQRGNIINMIREAAHEHGEEFIEAVNTGSYLEK